MNRIFALVLQAAGGAAGAFAGLLVPPEILTGLLADIGLGGEAAVTADMAAIALCALGGVFGMALGATLAAILPAGDAEPVGTREDAAVSVPRLRRHLGENHGQPKRQGSPLERLSAPPAGQQLPPHDLSHIPPAPKDDEITFDRIPNTGFYADIESPMNFDDGDDGDDEDLARFSSARIEPDHLRFERNSTCSDWGDDAGDVGQPAPALREAPAHADPDTHAFRPHVAQPLANGIGTDEFVDEWGDEADLGTTASPAEADWNTGTARDFAGQPADDNHGPGAFADPSRTPVRPVPERVPSRPDPVPTHHALQRPTGHDGYTAPRFAPGLTGGMESDWFSGEADEEDDADDDGAGYGSLMAIGLGKTHKPRAQVISHRPGEANLSPMPMLDSDRDRSAIPRGAGPQDFRLREALEELKRM